MVHHDDSFEMILLVLKADRLQVGGLPYDELSFAILGLPFDVRGADHWNFQPRKGEAPFLGLNLQRELASDLEVDQQ